MPRPKLVDRRKPLTIQIPESIDAKLRSELYSEVEGGIPLGAISEVVNGLIISWLKSRGVVV